MSLGIANFDVEPIDADQKLTPLRRFFKMLSLDRREILVIYAYTIFNGLINLSLPLGVQAIIGFVLSAEFSSSWGILIFIVVAGVAAAGVIQILQLSLTELLQRRIFTRASFDFAYRIPRFKMEAMTGWYAPELMNRFFDTLTVQKGLSKILIDFSSSSMQILFGLILLSFYHPFFVFFGILLLGLIVLIFFLTGPKGLKTSMFESKHKYQVAHWLEELARVMGTFKLAGKTDLPVEKMNGFVNNYLAYRKQHFSVLIFQYSNIVGFKTIITGGLLILGSLLVINQEINLGQFVASEIIILLVLSAVEKLILSMETVYDVLTGIEKLGQVTDIPLESDEGINIEEHIDSEGLNIELAGLSYGFAGSDEPCLSNISLSIKDGEKICIQGGSQSGKSTLISLISGLYDDYQGSILFNGIPLKNINITSLRSQIGNHLSHQDLFNGTLAENLSLGKTKITIPDMLWAIEQVGLNPYFKELKDGLNTIIKPEGIGLSSSIKQKIILARVLAKKPKLIIMDNLLDGLGEKDRERIYKLVTSKDNPWTLIAISNDSLMMDNCDRIINMEDGEIVSITNLSATKA